MLCVIWFRMLTYFTHTLIFEYALKSPEGDLRQTKKKPFPFYSSGRSHGIARVIKLEDFLVMISL